MSYHLAKIPKGEYGWMSKVEEEIAEFRDAQKQKSTIMMHLELSDIYGALEAVAEYSGLTMNDLKIMSDITKRAFRDGTRK